ncbi:uncharacterized protein LOC121678148 [Alosa sapidissima]|uniref:uncharacterized protein LOC121678148 n=1 Tax=Alosa sapidissima TaxID=34773 RepID=UPI001C07F68B|nr:uncharacterized protein LOC121678148 [Alosa sapidissima]
MMHRSFVSVRETALFIAGDSGGPDTKSELEIGDWILQKLSHVKYTWPQPFNLNLVSHYSRSDGFKVCVESALNLPWCAFPMGICTLCPPAAVYQGPPWLAHDRPNFIQCLVLNSSYSAPQWADGYMSFHQRVYHKYMTAIIHLYAVSVVPIEASEHMHDSNDNQKIEFSLKLGQQCWTAVPTFTHGYCNTGRYQLPLFTGTPSQKVLSALRNGKCKHVLKGLLHNNEVQLLSGASVFVRVADGRRHQELEQPAAKDAQRSFLHFLKAEDPLKLTSTPPLHQLIPESLRSQSEVFSRQLATQFKQVVHQDLGYQSLNREALKPMGPVSDGLLFKV